MNEGEDVQENHFRERVFEVLQLEKSAHLHGKELFADAVPVYTHPQEMIKVPPVWLRAFQTEFLQAASPASDNEVDSISLPPPVAMEISEEAGYVSVSLE